MNSIRAWIERALEPFVEQRVAEFERQRAMRKVKAIFSKRRRSALRACSFVLLFAFMISNASLGAASPSETDYPQYVVDNANYQGEVKVPEAPPAPAPSAPLAPAPSAPSPSPSYTPPAPTAAPATPKAPTTPSTPTTTPTPTPTPAISITMEPIALYESHPTFGIYDGGSGPAGPMTRAYTVDYMDPYDEISGVPNYVNPYVKAQAIAATQPQFQSVGKFSGDGGKGIVEVVGSIVESITKLFNSFINSLRRFFG